MHPNIARLYDAGITGEEIPYFVMEFIDGAPLDRYCRERALGIDERLGLFQQVCAAVEYAHSQFIVHCDLKPANVLVDRFGQVKLLDFGIAKWLDSLDDDGTLTQTLHRALTPSHAAPEQFKGEPVTTATDVYQLGLLLYRVLTGRRAHGADTDSAEQLRSAVLDRDPDAPSRAVSLASSRRLQGDVDAIVLKALRKEPADRYATVEALRRDIDHHLAHRPVAARRGSTTYVLRKYLRRHRVGAAAVLAIVLSSAIGLGIVTRQSYLLASERDRARDAEARASAINAFLVNDLLAAATPEGTQGTMPTVDAVLDLAERGVAHAFEGQPAAAAEVRLTLARSYASLGRPVQARGHAEAAVALLAEARGVDPLAPLRARALVAELAHAEGRYANARDALTAVLAEQEALAGPAHPDTLRTRGLLAGTLRRLGEVASAEREISQAVRLATEAQGHDRRLGIELRALKTDILNAQGRTLEAEAVSDELVALARSQYGAAHPRTIDALALRASVLITALKYHEAIEANRELLALTEQVYGADHPATGRASRNVAIAISRLHGNAADDAYEPSVRALDIFRRALGEDHPETIQSLRNLGIWNRYKRRHAEAERIYRTVYDARRRTLGDHHRTTLESARALTTLLHEMGRTKEAAETASWTVLAFAAATAREDAPAALLDDFAMFLLEAQPPDVRNPPRALALAERAVAASGRRDYLRLRTLSTAQRTVGRMDDAIATLREALALPDAIVSWTLERALVELMREHRSPADLEAWLVQRLDQYPHAGRGDDFAVARTLRHLADLYEREGRLEEAEQRLTEALAQARKTVGDTHFEVAETKIALASVQAVRGHSAAIERMLVEGFEALIADYRTGLVSRTAARDRVAGVYDRWGRTTEAARWRQRPLQ